MTRLISEWVSPMLSSMEAYNRKLKEITGCDLCGLVGDIFGADEASFTSLQRQINVGIVPITQGEGIIGDFSEAIASIIASMGFRTLVTEHTDVDGIYEACRRGAICFSLQTTTGILHSISPINDMQIIITVQHSDIFPFLNI